MNFEFDPNKDELNQIKHGISLASAAQLDWPSALIWDDTRKEYGEPRQIALTPLNDRLYCVVFVKRNNIYRIISLRKANSREFKHYAAQTNTTD